MKNSFYIAGGDLRSVYLSKALIKEGHEVKLFAMEEAEAPENAEKFEDFEEFYNADAVVLPLPSVSS